MVGRTTILLALLLSSTAALAQTAEDLAEKFGSRESVQGIAINPSGTRLSIIEPRAGGGESIAVYDLSGAVAPVTMPATKGSSERLQDCGWASDERLVCRLHLIVRDEAGLSSVTRLLSLDYDGSDLKVLTTMPNSRALYDVGFGGRVLDYDTQGSEETVLMGRYFVPEAQVGSILSSRSSGLGVVAIDTRSGKEKLIETGRDSAVRYVSDGQGNVRMMATRRFNNSGYSEPETTYFFRTKAEDDWQEFGKVVDTASGFVGFYPAAIDSASDSAYLFGGHDGRTALFRRSLVAGSDPELVLAHDKVDVDQLITIGRDDRVVGASFATDRRQVEFFDPQLKKLAADLRAALPGSPLIEFFDASADEGKLVLLASSDTDPGTFYLYDKKAGSLAKLLSVRPELAGAKLAPVKPIAFTSRDGVEIPAYLTLPIGTSGKGLPAIVLPHGGPSARDEWGFDWLAQFLAARGYAVIQPNFRGSAGYGSEWFQDNGFQSWETAINDVSDSGRWLISEGIADPDRLAILGWSYGGYAALQAAVVERDLFAAVAAIAPVTDLDLLKEESRNYSNFRLVEEFVGKGAHIEAGSPASNAAAIQAPVLLAHGTLDQNVGVTHSRRMRDKLTDAGRQVGYLEFEGSDHYLDDAAARKRLLLKIDAFLASSMPEN